MVTLVNRAKVNTTTTGTGTINLGSAVDGYQTFADAGVVNTNVVRYTIEDGEAWEIGSGTYSSGTLTRSLDESSTGSLLNLSGEAVVYVTATGSDLLQPSDIGSTVQGYDANIVSDASYVHTDNNYTTTEKNKLAGIEAGATADQTKADIDALGIAASTANTLATARNISLTGDVSGSTNFDGSGNVSITAVVADDSHNHVISNVDGLQTALDGKLSTSGKAADSNLLDGIDSSSFARYDSNGTLSNALASGAWVSNYSSSTNVDHVWHDDGANAWNFNSDTTFKTTANSRVNAGSFYAGGNVVWNAGNDGSGSGLDADLLDGVQGSSYLRSDTSDTANGNISFASGADLSGGLDSNLTGFFLPQNPEGKHLKSPYFFNDIAYARLKGATVSVDVDGTPMTSTSTIDAMLNANGDFWNMSTAGVTTATITITNLPKGLTYGAYMGLSFGNTNWRANSITLEYSTDNGSTWTTARSTTSNSEEYFLDSFSTSGTATNALRWTLEDFNSSSMRVVSLFAYNYNSSGMEGLYVTRDGGDIYGNITVNGTLFGETLQANGASLLQKYQSTWSYPTHDIVYNGYQTTLGDYTYLKSAGNGSTDHGQVIVADNGVYFGKTNVETGAVVNSATAPFDNTTYGYFNSSGLTVTGTITASDRINAHEIRTNTNQELILNAGESASYATGQTGEYVYVNAENGLQINTSPDNWSSGWAGRDTFTFSSSGMQFPDGTTQTTAAPADEQDYGLITGSITTTNDYGALT